MRRLLAAVVALDACRQIGTALEWGHAEGALLAACALALGLLVLDRG